MSVVDLVIAGRARDLGGFSVQRVLPSITRRLIGPFIFFDHFGPVEFAPGLGGMDVRPHPHVALATVSYLFEGEIFHRDSLGSEQLIVPGDVNWMLAGRGIVHSERTRAETRARGGRSHGIQSWVALPTADEDLEPRFEHHAEATLPVVRGTEYTLRVIAGSAYGQTAPTGVRSPTLYVHAKLERGASVDVDETHEERAVYAADGAIECNGERAEPNTMLVLRPGAKATVRALEASNVMLVGGARLDGPRYVWWNFVASSKERIIAAAHDWKAGKFPTVPGDEIEFIPLNDEPHFPD